MRKRNFSATLPAQNSLLSHPDRFFREVPENADQFEPNKYSGILDVIIGLDFGTSATKVIVRVPNYTGSPAFAIPFSKFAHHSLEHLLPTRLAVGKDGKCGFLPEPTSKIFDRIKVELMQRSNGSVAVSGEVPKEATPMTIATAYLALVMRYARCWFFAYKKSIFKGFEIKWAINIGLPAAIDDDVHLRESFNVAGKAAWLLSRESGSIFLKDACRIIQDIKHSGFDEESLSCDFALVPEVIAEVVGYARSPLRNEGLHFLMDVGAGTLDVCAFLLGHSEENDDRYNILTADVKLLGAQHLHQDRVESIVKKVKKQFDAHDPLSPIPSDPKRYVPEVSSLIKEVDTVNARFKDGVDKAIYRIVWQAKKCRDPNSSRWSERLPIFICGGARSVDTYQNVINRNDKWFEKYISTCPGFREIPLKKPPALEANVDEEDYHRLAVAWGLSHESFDIGDYGRPSEVPDVPPRPVRDISDRFISKDMV